MYLEENLTRLNNKYNSEGLSFIREGNLIKIKEEKPYIFNQFKGLKDLLKQRYSLKFIPNILWHFDQAGIDLLNNYKLKLGPSINSEDLKSKLDSFINLIEEDDLKQSLTDLFINHKIFYTAPGAKFHHHAYIVGLLEHTIQVVELSIENARIMEQLDSSFSYNSDLLISGAILHDIGKMYCYDFSEDSPITLSTTFKQQEHIIHGVKIVSQEIRSKFLDQIIHIIASHHNTKEWGSPVEPGCYEAWIVHFADGLSSKILG